MLEKILDFLRTNGPSTCVQIASGVDCSRNVAVHTVSTFENRHLVDKVRKGRETFWWAK